MSSIGWLADVTGSSRIHYMANYTPSHVLSIRLTPELLEAVREQARLDGRSVSGEVVSIVKEQLAGRAVARTKPRKIMGWLSHLDVPEKHSEFAAGRAEASATLLRGVLSRGRNRAGK